MPDDNKHKQDDVSKSNICFVLMPFKDEFSNQWELAFIPAIEESNLKPFRADEEALGTNMIMKDITKSIYDARIIIADLTGRNANVMYELGLAHAAKKPVIVIAQNDGDVPFDLKHIRYIKYSDKNISKLKTDLKARIRSTLSQTESYYIDFFPELRIMDEEIIKEINYLREKMISIDICVSPDFADVFFNGKLLKPGTKIIRVNPDSPKNTISAVDLRYLENNTNISEEHYKNRKILIELEERERSKEDEVLQRRQRISRWFREIRKDPDNPVLMVSAQPGSRMERPHRVWRMA